MERAKHVAYTLSLFAGLIFIGARVDNDTWFLLNHGRYVAAHGIPFIEPFTLHEGWHFVMQQWLYALGLWEWYRAFGTGGLFVFPFLAGAVIIFLFDRLVRWTAEGNRAAECAIVLPVGAYLSHVFFCQRPQMASTAIFLAEIYLLERFQVTRPRWMYLAIPALSALLINVHAAMWPMLLVFLLPYLAEALFGARLASHLPHDSGWRVREIVLLLVLSAAAGFASPYGLDAMLYTAHSYGVSEISSYVAEMAPVSVHRSFSVGLFPLAVMGALIVIYTRHAVPLRHLLLAGGTAFLALCALRSLFLFALFATFPLARLLRAWRPAACAWPAKKKRYVVLLLLANYVLFARILQPIYTQPAVPPSLVAAAGELCALAAAGGRSPQDVRIYTSFGLGSYFEFRSFRCYMDDRAEVFRFSLNRKEDLLAPYVAMQSGKLAYGELFEGCAFDWLLVDRDDTLWHQLPEDDAYECIWSSETSGAPADDDVRIYRKKGRTMDSART